MWTGPQRQGFSPLSFRILPLAKILWIHLIKEFSTNQIEGSWNPFLSKVSQNWIQHVSSEETNKQFSVASLCTTWFTDFQENSWKAWLVFLNGTPNCCHMAEKQREFSNTCTCMLVKLNQRGACLQWASPTWHSREHPHSNTCRGDWYFLHVRTCL